MFKQKKFALLVIFVSFDLSACFPNINYLKVVPVNNDKLSYYNADTNRGKLMSDTEIVLFDENHIDLNVMRDKRDLDFSFEAETDGDDTQLSAEAIANLFSSKDGKTKVDGSATYNQRFNDFNGNSNPSFKGRLTFKLFY